MEPINYSKDKVIEHLSGQLSQSNLANAEAYAVIDAQNIEIRRLTNELDELRGVPAEE